MRVVSEYDKALEQRAKEIKAKGFDPSKVELAKTWKSLSDMGRLHDLAAKEGNKAWAKKHTKGYRNRGSYWTRAGGC